MIFEYLSFALALGFLCALPTNWYRLVYLHGISTLGILGSSTTVNFYILLAMIHSAIHHLWPFLTKTGYDPQSPPFYDVLCHTVMLYFSHELIRPFLGTWIYLSWFFLLGSVANTFNSLWVTPQGNSRGHEAFRWTSVFQAISTGSWVSTMLWYGHWMDPVFVYHWLGTIVAMVCHWGLYSCSEKMLAFAMKYNYIEAIFIVCTWVAAFQHFFF